jgi:hypothetical protein
MKETNERNQQKKTKKMEIFYDITFAFFFTSDSTTTTKILSYMMESQFPNLDVVLRYVGHLLRSPNVKSGTHVI